MSDLVPTAEERKIIKALEALEKSWPKTLWLFANGTLYLMREPDKGGSRSDANGEMDQSRILWRSRGIHNDGGDW